MRGDKKGFQGQKCYKMTENLDLGKKARQLNLTQTGTLLLRILAGHIYNRFHVGDRIQKKYSSPNYELNSPLFGKK